MLDKHCHEPQHLNMWDLKGGQLHDHPKQNTLSNVIRHGMHLDILGSGAPSSKILKAQETWCISFLIAFFHKSVPVSWSISSAHFTARGTSRPNLLSRFFILAWIVAMIRFLFLSADGTHNAACSTNLFATEYSATSIGFEIHGFFKGSHDEDPSFQATCKCHPWGVFLRFCCYHEWCTCSQF